MTKALLVLEPLNHIYGVINAAKARGLAVVVMHTLPLVAPVPFAYGADNIDLAIEIDGWHDVQALSNQLEEQAPWYEFVGTYTATEITLPLAAWVQQKFQLPGTPYKTLKRCLDKDRVRKTLHDRGLTELRSLDMEAIGQLEHWPFDGPGYFKPVNGSGSVNVKQVSTLSELKALISAWQDKSHIHFSVLRDYIERNNRYFLEEAAKGELLSVESFVQQGELSVLGMSSRAVLARDTAVEMGGSFPYEHPFKLQIIDKVRAIHKVLGITHGPTHTEVMVDDVGHVETD